MKERCQRLFLRVCANVFPTVSVIEYQKNKPRVKRRSNKLAHDARTRKIMPYSPIMFLIFSLPFSQVPSTLHTPYSTRPPSLPSLFPNLGHPVKGCVLR